MDRWTDRYLQTYIHIERKKEIKKERETERERERETERERKRERERDRERERERDRERGRETERETGGERQREREGDRSVEADLQSLTSHLLTALRMIRAFISRQRLLLELLKPPRFNYSCPHGQLEATCDKIIVSRTGYLHNAIILLVCSFFFIVITV